MDHAWTKYSPVAFVIILVEGHCTLYYNGPGTAAEVPVAILRKLSVL